jgi:hypothetical protein
MKAYWGSGCIVPRILDLGTRWMSVVSRTPRPLYPQKSPWYPLGRRLGGPQSRAGRGDKGKNSQLLPGLEPPTIQPVAQFPPLYSLLLTIQTWHLRKLMRCDHQNIHSVYSLVTLNGLYKAIYFIRLCIRLFFFFNWLLQTLFADLGLP